METECIYIYICSGAGKALSLYCLGKAVSDYAFRIGEKAAAWEEDGWKIEKGGGGKPFFPEYPWINYSISHSGNYWCCAISAGQVGLDVQLIQDDGRCPPLRRERIAERFFHPSEREYLLRGGSFFRIWAAKESYVKYTGEGITPNFDSFAVADAAGLLPSVIGEGRPAEVRSYILHPSYELCLCAGCISSVRFCYI